MRHCNSCTRRDCRVVESFRRDKRSTVDMSADCGIAQRPLPWTQPLIFTALITSPQGVHDSLKSAGLGLQELAHRPYFRLFVLYQEGN